MPENMRERILEAALPLVPFDGWCDAVLMRATSAAGYSPVMCWEAFPGGVADLVDYFCEQADRAMLAAATAQNIGTLRIRDRIRLLVLSRLEWLRPHREAVRRTLAFYALPPHAVRGLRVLYRMADAAWVAAGDTSTDYNHYTKRLLLSGVYSTTLLAWLADDAPNDADTQAFLDRRIEDVMRIQRAKSALSEGAARLWEPLAGCMEARRYG